MKNELKLLLPKISQLKICRESDTYGAKMSTWRKGQDIPRKTVQRILTPGKNKMLKRHDHFDLEVFKACATNCVLWL